MENFDIIILTSIISTLFVVFGLVVYREIKTATENYKPSDVESGPRADMIKFIGSLFDQSSSKKIDPLIGLKIMKQVKRTISDMETDGVYFPIEIKIELEKKRKEMICEYSGLPSVGSFSDEKNKTTI